MVRFSVFYPASEGAKFDHDYYRDSHVPLCVKTWSPVDVTIERGIEGQGPNVAAVHLTFESADALAAAMGSEGTGEVLMDVANYTDITPITQVSEIVS
jgi:uncharacterized protein (TIGR02118 family)